MKHADPFPQRQLRTLLTVALLSPVLRLIPGSAAALAGRAAWLGPLAALPLLLLYIWFLERLRGAMEEGEALPELILRVLGNRGGRALLLLLGAWLLLYSGFVLRSGADRFLITVFPHSAAAFFVVTMGLLSLLAALGTLQSLVRVARMIAPVLFFTLLLILLAALGGLDRTALWPLTLSDAGALLKGAVPSLDIVAFGLAASCFFRPGQGREEGRSRRTALWALGMVLLLTAVGAGIQGRFGAALCTWLSVPFFTLVRNLVFFQSMERMEALVVALWVFPDFLLTGLSLQAAQHCLRLAAGKTPKAGERRTDMRNGRWIILLCGAAAITLGLLLAQSQPAMLLWSRQVIPLVSLAVALIVLPAIWVIARFKTKKQRK